MNKFSKELVESLTEACEHADGKPWSVRIAGRREEPATPARRASFGITANTTAEPAGQPHQVGVFERLIRSGQRPPPHTEPPGEWPMRKYAFRTMRSTQS